jgi:K+ transporter
VLTLLLTEDVTVVLGVEVVLVVVVFEEDNTMAVAPATTIIITMTIAMTTRLIAEMLRTLLFILQDYTLFPLA